MKAIFITILNFCLIQAVQAQDKPQSKDDIIFEQAIARFEAEDYQAAAEGFQQLMNEYPQSPLLARAHYNLALSRYRMKEYETSKKLFREILEEPYNEQDENSLMEPYALYKHHSCRYLAAMALQKKDYKATEKYIYLFDKEYPYQHFCGNEWSAYHMYKALMSAKVYEGTDRVKKAIEELVPYIFSDALASNTEVLNELSEIMDRHFTKEETQLEFKRALESLQVKEKKKETSATIQLFDITIKVEEYFFGNSEKKTSAQEYYQQKVKENWLFQKYL